MSSSGGMGFNNIPMFKELQKKSYNSYKKLMKQHGRLESSQVFAFFFMLNTVAG